MTASRESRETGMTKKGDFPKIEEKRWRGSRKKGDNSLMVKSANKPNGSTFSRNLLILGSAVMGKSVLSLLLYPLLNNTMVVELLSLGAMAIAIFILLSVGYFASEPDCPTSGEASETIGAGTLTRLRSALVPLVGLMLCESTQGMGWGASLTGSYSAVPQTHESFMFVMCGTIIGATTILLVRSHVKNIMNFHYFSILASLLLLVVPWMGSDISGGAKVLITATPWGFSAAVLIVVSLIDIVNAPRPVAKLAFAAVIGCILCSFILGGVGIYLLGNDMMEALWRGLLIILIAVSALEILREYRHLEHELDRTTKHTQSHVAEEYGLTAREQEILALIVQGRTSLWIAQKLYISDNTVRSHMKHIYQKCGVHTRNELIDLLDKE